MIKYISKQINFGVEAHIAAFAPQNGIPEYHLILTIADGSRDFETQLSDLHKAYQDVQKEFKNVSPVMARYFISDTANQSSFIQTASPLSCPYSIVGQPPLQGSKLALWIWFQGETTNYRHIYTLGITSSASDTKSETIEIFEQYLNLLHSQSLTLASDCVRTWLFVRDVDRNYAAVVQGRKDVFSLNGLTEKSHYITSTGIEARNMKTVTMDAYSVSGLTEGQQHYLYAPAYLNPTYEYGVTFERGVYVQYGDRRHIFISGTASIDNKGAVLHLNDIKGQIHRMWENVQALLLEADATSQDMVQAIVYLRDIADYEVVCQWFQCNLPDLPIVITQAPVCRPSWLIEMECMAITSHKDIRYKAF